MLQYIRRLASNRSGMPKNETIAHTLRMSVDQVRNTLGRLIADERIALEEVGNGWSLRRRARIAGAKRWTNWTTPPKSPKSLLPPMNNATKPTPISYDDATAAKIAGLMRGRLFGAGIVRTGTLRRLPPPELYSPVGCSAGWTATQG